MVREPCEGRRGEASLVQLSFACNEIAFYFAPCISVKDTQLQVMKAFRCNQWFLDSEQCVTR